MSARAQSRQPILEARLVFAFWATGSAEERCQIERFVDKLLREANVRLEDSAPGVRLVVDNTRRPS
ncbi:MAG TPA: hypothetical protein VGR92_06035 [Steroidobacteraceae bacterium]|nr:hypothetical protein [Steroidobacteraceae bacterium]